MNRDELLTKLAMELGEWPKTLAEASSNSTPEPHAQWVFFNQSKSVVAGVKFPIGRKERLYIGENEWLQRRAELINRPSWGDAPEWAEWLCQQRSGGWYWCDERPEIKHGHWVCDSALHIGEDHASRGSNPKGHNWRETLEERPSSRGYAGGTIFRAAAVDTGLCSDGAPCGSPHNPDDDQYCIGCPNEPMTTEEEEMPASTHRSDGSTASYYELPENASELQDLISYRNMNSQDGEIFRAIYRKGRASHSDELRDAKKVLFYAKAEVERLERYGQ